MLGRKRDLLWRRCARRALQLHVVLIWVYRGCWSGRSEQRGHSNVRLGIDPNPGASIVAAFAAGMSSWQRRQSQRRLPDIEQSFPTTGGPIRKPFPTRSAAGIRWAGVGP